MQTSVPLPVSAELWHERPLRDARELPLEPLIPLPCNLIRIGAIAEALVSTLRSPVESSLELGVYWTFTLIVLPPAMVNGALPWPLIENVPLVKLN